jgi:hypothetical protein
MRPVPSRPLGPGPAGTKLWKIMLIVAAGMVPALLLPELLGGFAYGASGLMAYVLGEISL